MIEILIIEEDRRRALLAQECLTRDFSAGVTVAGDGEEALRLLAADGYRPNLVLLELTPKSLPGHHVLRRIRRSKPKLPIVILSPSNEVEDVCQAYAEGANMFVEEPADLNAFRRTIQTIARLWVEPLAQRRAATAG